MGKGWENHCFHVLGDSLEFVICHIMSLLAVNHFSFLLIWGWLSVCVLSSCFFEDPQGEMSLGS